MIAQVVLPLKSGAGLNEHFVERTRLMNIWILGARGGIGGSARITSILADPDILIGAGTGVGDPAIPTLEASLVMIYQAMLAESEIALDHRRIRCVSVNHVEPAVGYLGRTTMGGLVFSGDTTITNEFRKVLNATEDLKHVIIETS